MADRWQVLEGDCLAVMPTLAENSVDAIVCDPPYGLSFMGRDWDHGVPGEHFWREALRVAKPGAWLLAFGGTRTFHRLACAIEDAGWEMRDCVGLPHESGDWGDCPWLLAWCYGSGFPKSADISKHIDKAAGITRRVRGCNNPHYDGYTRQSYLRSHSKGKRVYGAGNMNTTGRPVTIPATGDALRWDGFGTALKPAWEPVIVARKPLDGTVAANVLKWGTGGINVDGCRIQTATDDPRPPTSWETPRGGLFNPSDGTHGQVQSMIQAKGRWPANLCHDGSEQVLRGFPNTGNSRATNRGLQHSGRHGGLADLGDNIKDGTDTVRGHNDNGGSAARFFYCAKASRGEREAGLEGMSSIIPPQMGMKNDPEYLSSDGIRRSGVRHAAVNTHCCVKPLSLMRWLCRLVTPPGGLILDPFAGSGSTGCAAVLEGFRFVGIEREAEYAAIARARIEHWAAQRTATPELEPVAEA